MKCLFCSNINDNSDEHIVLNSLNGKLHSKEIICSICNNFFGLELDHIAKKYFNTIILILELKNASGIPSENLEGEQNFLIQNDLKIRQVKLDITKHTIGSKEIINISGDEKHVSGYFKKEIERLESKGKKLITHTIDKINRDGGQKIEVNFKTPPLFNTLMNKIALQFCQFHKIELTGAQELINKTRKLDVDMNNIHYCNIDNSIRMFESYEITHLLVVKSINQKLYVYIELFNVVCALVLISESYSGNEIDFQYYQDVISGEKLKNKVPINEERILEIINEKKFKKEEDFGPLVNKLFIRKADKEFKTTLDKELDLIQDELKLALENKFIADDEYAQLFVEKSAKIIAQLSIEFPYMIEDWDDANNDEINYIHSNLRDNQFDSFCEQYAPLIGKKVDFSNGDKFFIEKFTKVPIIEQNGIVIIRVLVVLHDGFSRTYIPYRDFFEGIMANFDVN